jgi:integrase
MFLSKRNGIYYLWYTNESGRKQKISTHTSHKPQAIQFLRDFHSKGNNSRVTLSALLAELIKVRSGEYAEGTLDIYQKSFRHLQRLFGDIRIRLLSPYHFDRYKAERLKAVSATTVNIELRALKAALGVATKWKMIESNPFSRLELARLSEQAPVYFTRTDFKLLLESIKEAWLRDVILFALLSGARRGEIVNLRWTDVDLDNRLVHIQSGTNFRTKTGKRRTIPTNDLSYHLLMNRRDISSCGYVFSNNNHKLMASWVTHRLKRYVRKLGLNHRLHFHSLRHSTGSWLAQGGISIYQISRLLGHSTVRTTEMFYAHLEPSALREAVGSLALAAE